MVIIDAKFRPRFHLLSYLPSTAACNYSENERNSLFRGREISENSRGARENFAEFELGLYSPAGDYGKFLPLASAEEVTSVKSSGN